MIIEGLTLGADTMTLLKNKVGQMTYDFLTRMNTDKGSLPRQGNIAKITAPFIATSDIPKEEVIQAAKAVEIKLAMDVRTFLEINIKETAADLNIRDVMNSIPITVLNKGAGNSDSITEIVRDRFNGVLSDKLLTKEALEYDMSKEAIAFSEVRVTAHYSEAMASSSGIVSDRNALPTTVRVGIKYITGRGEVKDVEFNVSIECIPRYIDSEDLRVRLGSYSNKDFYKNFVRLEKGEINFLTDWMLDLKMLKAKAKAAARGDRDIFHIIDQKRLLNDMGVNVYPFLVMMVSSEFNDMLRTKDHLNLYEDANDIMKKFFCMGILIYNQENARLSIKYDGDKAFKECLFDDIGKDTAKYERELKQLIKFNR